MNNCIRLWTALLFMTACGSFLLAGELKQGDLERLYRVQLTSQTEFTIATVMSGGSAGPSDESLLAWCADACLTSEDGSPSPEYQRAVAAGKNRFGEKAGVVLVSGIQGQDLQQGLQAVLQEALDTSGVYHMLAEQISNRTPDSCINKCVAYSRSARPPQTTQPPWQLMVRACTANDESLVSHIVMHFDDPGLPPQYRKAAVLLDGMPAFWECLRTSLKRTPEVESAVNQLYMGVSDEGLRSARQASWQVWQQAGVPAIIDAAAQEEPNKPAIEQMIASCNGSSPP